MSVPMEVAKALNNQDAALIYHDKNGNLQVVALKYGETVKITHDGAYRHSEDEGR